MNYKDVFAYLINKQKILINFLFLFFGGGLPRDGKQNSCMKNTQHFQIKHQN